MTESVASEVALLKRPGFVGRAPELRVLKDALRRARGGEGSAWLLEGAEGIGKTRVARWLEELARTEGFDVRWGYGVREGMVPFLPYELMFRSSRRDAAAPRSAEVPETGERAPIVLVEEPRPRRFWGRVERTIAKGPLLVASRERPTAIRTNRPALAEAKAILWITRLEGADHVAPSALDALADRFEEHLRSAKGATVALEGAEYLVSQGSFLPVLRLVQFLRDVAQETGGQLMLSLNPSSLEPREVSLLEAESEVDSEEATPSGDGRAPSGPASPTQTLLQLLSQVEEASERAPQLLVLDDLQWADLPSQRAFQFLVRNTRERPVLWLACLRTEGDPASVGAGSSGFQEIGEHMESEGALTALPLRPLSPEEIRHLVEGATEVPLDVEHGDPEFRTFLERTQGNPHFALSSLRLLWEQGRIRHRGDRAVVAPLSTAIAAPEGPSLPTTLQGAAASRIGLLDPGERRFLGIAANLGKDFDLEPIVPCLGRSLDEVRTSARRLEALHGLVRPLPGPPSDRWTFQDGTVWDAALSTLSPNERRQENRQLGVWWAEHRPSDVEGVARLLYASGDAELALPWIRKAIDHRLDLKSPEAVEGYLRWVRELSPSDPASVVARASDEVAVARALRRISANRAALRVLRALQTLELPPDLRRERDLALVNVLADTEVTEARGRLERLQEEVRAAPEGSMASTFRARVLGTQGYLDMTQGRFQDGRKASEAALELLPISGEEREQARDLFTSGWCCLELEEWDQAERRFVDTLALSRAHALKTTIAASLNGLATLSFFLGDLRAAERYYDEGIRVERDAGEAPRTIPFLLNLAEAIIAQGDLTRTWSVQEEAARLSEKFDLPRWRAGAAALKGDLLARERKWPEALQAYQLATEATRTQPLRSRLVQIQLGVAWATGESGDPSAARTVLQELEADPAGIPAQYTDQFLQVRARLKELGGDPPGARQDLEAARSKTGPSPCRQARVLGDLSSWERLHGAADRATELRMVADRLYVSAGADPVKARPMNELFEAVGPSVRAPESASAT